MLHLHMPPGIGSTDHDEEQSTSPIRIPDLPSNGRHRSVSPHPFRAPPNSPADTESVSFAGMSDTPRKGDMAYKEVNKIACIGAGYVGGSVLDLS